MKHIALTAAAGLAAFTLAACGSGADATNVSGTDSAAIATAAALFTGSESPAEMEALYGSFLAKYISDADGINLINYGGVTPEDRAALQAYITSLETRGIAELSEDEEIAFWINLYNAKTIDLILDHYPLSSIRKIGGILGDPWKLKLLNVAGIGEMTLNDVEHGQLRAKWDEPRIHYAVNCASIGCPNLKASPWTAATLESDFETSALEFINHPRGARVENGKVTVSKIYSWYKEDFDDSNDGVLEHVREYAEGDLAAALDAATDIDQFEYNWDLNEG